MSGKLERNNEKNEQQIVGTTEQSQLLINRFRQQRQAVPK